MSDVLDDLQAWVDERAVDLAARGIQVAVAHGPVDSHKRASWVDLDSPTHAARLIVWESGEAILEVGDLAGNAELALEQLEITTRFGLVQALSWAVNLVAPDSPPARSTS
jgi:hypothetical protein